MAADDSALSRNVLEFAVIVVKPEGYLLARNIRVGNHYVASFAAAENHSVAVHRHPKNLFPTSKKYEFRHKGGEVARGKLAR